MKIITLKEGRQLFVDDYLINELTNCEKKYYSAEKLHAKTEEESKLAAIIALRQYLKDQQQLRLPITE